MSQVKIRIYRGKSFNDRELVRTAYVETNFDKKITGKKAGQILANNFPEFDRLDTRNGLQKSDEGFLAMRPFKPTDKCDYQHFWEYAVVNENTE